MKLKVLMTIMCIFFVNSAFAKNDLLSLDCDNVDDSGTIYKFHYQINRKELNNKNINYILWDDQRYPIVDIEELGNAIIAWSESYIDVSGRTMQLGIAIESNKFYAVTKNVVLHKFMAVMQIYCRKALN